MRQLATMGIQVWQQRRVGWPCLELTSNPNVYIVCSTVYQAVPHQALWSAIAKAMSRWEMTTRLLTTDDLQALPAGAIIYNLADNNDLKTPASVRMMPSLQSMLDDPSQKAILWNAVKDSMSQA